MENKFDLKKAKDLAANPIHCSETDEVFRQLVDEVERLRSENNDCLHERVKWFNYSLSRQLTICSQKEEIATKDVRIKRLEASLENAEALVRKNASAMNGYLARIKELQAEIERIDAAFLEATKEIVYATHEGRDAPEGEDAYAEKVAREALEQLRAEGKIGGVKTEYGGQHHCGTQIIRNDAGEWHCPKCNPLLTAEQREALEHVIEYVQETQMPISNLNEFDMQELRSLLTGSKPAWEVTEERKSAILDGMMAIARLQQIGEEQWGDEGEAGVLRAMLEEAKRDA